VSQGFLEGHGACFGRQSQIAVKGPLEAVPVPVAKGFGVGAELNENEVGLKGVEQAQGPLKTLIIAMDDACQDQMGTIGEQCC
jgi:hypothetical protein